MVFKYLAMLEWENGIISSVVLSDFVFSNSILEFRAVSGSSFFNFLLSISAYVSTLPMYSQIIVWGAISPVAITPRPFSELIFTILIGGYS